MFPHLQLHYMAPFVMLAGSMMAAIILWRVVHLWRWQYGSLRYVLEFENLTNRCVVNIAYLDATSTRSFLSGISRRLIQDSHLPACAWHPQPPPAEPDLHHDLRLHVDQLDPYGRRRRRGVSTQRLGCYREYENIVLAHTTRFAGHLSPALAMGPSTRGLVVRHTRPGG